MPTDYLTPEELLAGGNAVFDILIPAEILNPGENNKKSAEREMAVQIKPLTIETFQLIMKASKNDHSIIPLLMIKAALIKPELSLDKIKKFNLGLVNFLIGRIRNISGLTEKKTSMN